MAALTIERKTLKLGQDCVPSFPTNLPLPVAAAAKLYTGAMVALATTGANAGNVVSGQTATGLVALGVAEQTIDNTSGAAGALTVVPRQGVYLMNVGTGVDAIGATNVGQDCYMIDDNTVGLTNGGGTRSRAGVIVAVDGGTPPFSQPVGAWVLIGITGSVPAGGEDLPSQFKARNVVTSLQAYTGTGTNVLTETANGAWAAQDGVTNAVGDVVFIQAGTTNLTGALDSGPWQITSLGSAGSKWVLTRPTWFQTGEAVPVGQVVDVGGEGTLWAGSAWKSFATVGSAVIGTNDPAFYVGRVVQQVTLVAGAATVSNVGVKSAAKVVVPCTLVTANTATGTVGYGCIATTTAGYIGTASIPVKAYVANMTISAADVSTINVCVINW